MKFKKLALLLAMVLSFSFVLAGCGEKKLEGSLVGRWFYIHDTENVALNIKADGTAILDGEKYDCSFDEEKIYLTDKKGIASGHRYTVEGEGQMYFYKTATYRYQGTEPQNGLIGVWVDIENGKSNFEFTADGTFREDSYIPGYYRVNEEDNSIFLVYNDMYYDTTIYFTLKDDLLIVDYPWPMVKAK